MPFHCLACLSFSLATVDPAPFLCLLTLPKQEMETIVVAYLSKEMATSVNTLAATVTLAMKLLTVQ
jgi:hypothetical protein